VVICDFGLALVEGGVDLYSGPVGSSSYVAPEVLSHATYTRACDMWSLGACAHR
jgi:serine/threonine protein kinase